MGFFGFKHDRKLALQALAVAAAKSDVHSVFAGSVPVAYRRTLANPHQFSADDVLRRRLVNVRLSS